MTVSATVPDIKSSNFTLTTDRNFRRQTISMHSWRTCCHGSSHIYVANGVFVLIYHFNEQCRCPGPRPATQAGVIRQYQLNRCIRTSNNAKWLIKQKTAYETTKQYADRVSISVVQAIHDNGAEQIQLDDPDKIESR